MITFTAATAEVKPVPIAEALARYGRDLDRRMGQAAERAVLAFDAQHASCGVTATYEPTPTDVSLYLDAVDQDAWLAELAQREEEAEWQADYEQSLREQEYAEMAREAGGWDRISGLVLAS